MIVALDAEAAGDCVTAERYLREVVASLLARDAPVERVVVLTGGQNHAGFETLRDERCDLAMVRRPLFEGRTVRSWADLLSRDPRAGAELLSDHLAQKLRIVRELGASVVHFPREVAIGMDINAPLVVSLQSDAHWDGDSLPIAANLAHAVVVESEAARLRLCAAAGVAWAKAFVAACPESSGQVSTDAPPDADDEKRELRDLRARREAFAAAVCEAYEHALASFELKGAA